MTDSFEQWIGCPAQIDDSLNPFQCKAMNSLLAGIQSLESGHNTIPPLWHWLYFLDTPAQPDLANDGHEKRGNFLPPVGLPRRMWAASEIEFHQALSLNVNSKRESSITSIESKTGKSGELVFVSVLHEIYQQSALAISEKQTIVYRGATTGSSPMRGKAVEETPDFSKTVVPGISLLFRYSALTFNAHRIHYDRDYARDTEGYPGLIVHGPLLATLLLGALQEQYPKATVCNFEFRAMKPVFDTAPFKVCGQYPDSNGRAQLWIADQRNEICMQAHAQLDI